MIGTPNKMWHGVVIAREVLSQQLLFDFLDRYWVDTAVGPVWVPGDQYDRNAGGNFGPRALLGEVEGHLRGIYQTRHAEVGAQLYIELVERDPYRGNGLRQDGCLHQHNFKKGAETEDGGILQDNLGHIYTGEYGKEMLRHESLMMSWYSGTDLDYEENTVEGLYATFLECTQWLHRGHIMEPTVHGRKITEGSMVTHYGASGAIHDTGLNLQLMGRHLEEVEAVLHRYDNVLPDPEFALIGHRHFFNSDLTVQQRREYYASVRILSNRTIRPETYTTQLNVDGFFQADGYMTILVDGGEYGKRNNEVFQVYDWAKVPSVTNQYTTHIPNFESGNFYAKRFYNDAKFSGGVTDGYIGLASMVYNRPYVPLSALKSWFFFIDVIVVVGSGITLKPEDATSESVITTLTQIVFEGDYIVCISSGEELHPGWGNQSYSNPSWIYHRNVSYVFLDGDEDLFTSSETRLHDDEKIDVFTAWLDHTTIPTYATLIYAVLPATTVDFTRTFVNEPTVEIIAQEKNLHVVCHHPSMTIGASVIDGGKATIGFCGGAGPFEITIDIPCLVLLIINDYTPNSAEISLSVSDPQHVYDAVNIVITLEGRQVDQMIDLPLDPVRGASTTIMMTV